MIYFTAYEIIRSVLSALLYGLLFAFFVCFVELCLGVSRNGVKSLFNSLVLGKIIKRNNLLGEEKKTGAFLTFLFIILFSLGFILLSYLVLDGAIRFYTLIISTAATLVFLKLIRE